MVTVYRSIKNKVDYTPLGCYNKNDIKYVMIDDNSEISVSEHSGKALIKRKLCNDIDCQYGADVQEVCVKKTY